MCFISNIECLKYQYEWDQEEFEDTKETIRSRNSKDRQYNIQQRKDKRTNNDLQNIT
jgi:hypothetical protein